MHKCYRLAASITLCLSVVGTLLSSGCGTLHRDISWSQLSQDDMNYIQKTDIGSTDLSISVVTQKFETSRVAKRWAVVPPFLYFESFGAKSPILDRVSTYGKMKMTMFLPIYFAAKGSIYNADGKAISTMRGLGLVPLFITAKANDDVRAQRLSLFSLIPFPLVGGHIFSYSTFTDNDNTRGRYDFLQLPILGPCFSFGLGREHVLWIPFGENDMPAGMD